MRKPLLLFIFMMSSILLYSQTEKQKADNYLNERGELVFTFTANSLDEIGQLSNIVSFDHGQDPTNPLRIKAYANAKEFNKFLKFGLPYTVNDEENRPAEGMVMYDPNIHGSSATNRMAYTLSFPLQAYPTFQQYADQMNDFATDHPSIAQLVDIGDSENGKDLLFIKLSDNVTTHEQEPRVLLTSSMHGDEIIGYPMMISLIDFLIEVYNDPGHARHAEIKNLIDNSEIWINPLSNPDGMFASDLTNYDDVSGATRANFNNIDLNRNYPAPTGNPHPDGEVYQSETIAFMNLADTYHFVISANFHSGREVMNYPWDTWTVAQGRHADDDWYKYISTEYANHAQADSPSGYFNFDPDPNAPPGVTHGATWYQVDGGRQDYMNHDKQCRELTVELSEEKPIHVDLIDDHWDYNRDALVDYIKQGTYGFRGVVKDANTMAPIQAKITMVGHDDNKGSWVNTELPIGDFYRPIKAGTYTILIEADCYQSVTLSNQTIADQQTIDLSDILLTPVTPTVPEELAANNITTTSADLTWTVTIGGSEYDVRYRELGSSTWIDATSTTANYAVTGLTASTTYEYQVRSKCGAFTSDYSGSWYFTTPVQGYCTSRGSSQYDTGVTRVQFNTLLNAHTNNKANNGYQDFTADGGNKTTTVIQGESHTLTVNVDRDGGTGHAFAWIDFNMDGDFTDPGEEFDLGEADSGDDTTTSVTPSITIPIGASFPVGPTRMRIAASWNNDPAGPCATGYDGEVEDYSIFIISPVLSTNEVEEQLTKLSVYPNPANDQVFIKVPSLVKLEQYRLSNALGQVVLQDSFNNDARIDVQSITPGVYFLSIMTDRGETRKKLVIQ